MKKFLKETKWVLIIASFLILSICLVFIFLLPCEDQRLLAYTIIQASAIVTLVVVTLSYVYYTKNLADQAKEQSKHIIDQVKGTKELAESTKKLAEEQKAKITADFYEKRIKDFYKPFVKNLNDFKNEIHEPNRDVEKAAEIHKQMKYLYWEKRYMTIKETANQIKKLDVAMAQVEMNNQKELFKIYYEIEKDVRTILKNEWDDLEEKIRRYYKY